MFGSRAQFGCRSACSSMATPPSHILPSPLAMTPLPPFAPTSNDSPTWRADTRTRTWFCLDRFCRTPVPYVLNRSSETETTPTLVAVRDRVHERRPLLVTRLFNFRAILDQDFDDLRVSICSCSAQQRSHQASSIRYQMRPEYVRCGQNDHRLLPASCIFQRASRDPGPRRNRVRPQSPTCTARQSSGRRCAARRL